MDLYELMMNRRSVRNMEDRPVPEEIIEKLVDAANSAPSGGNMQPLSVILVQSAEGRKVLSDMNSRQPWIKNAPLSMIFCIDYNRVKRWALAMNTEFKGNSAFVHFLIAYSDIMCAAQNVVMLAESYGMGSVYAGTILSSIDSAREYFNMPKYVLPVMVLSIGYPKSRLSGIPKLKRENIVHREKYKDMTEDEILKAFEDKYGNVDDNVEKYFEKTYVEVLEAEKQDDTSWIGMAAEQMKRLDIKNNAEFLFKLRYPNEKMIMMNKLIVNSMKEAGFDFLLEENAVEGAKFNFLWEKRD